MAYHFDEHQLLALIEGNLDTQAAADLRRQLAADPDLLGQVDQMIAHRQSLRSLEQPALPCDFIAELEPTLVRAMLVETTPAARNGQAYVPGQARRAKQAGFSHRSLARYATAAGLVIAASAGLWAAAAGLGKP